MEKLPISKQVAAFENCIMQYCFVQTQQWELLFLSLFILSRLFNLKLNCPVFFIFKRICASTV